jgi:tRNA pseudouridine55 synthase
VGRPPVNRVVREPVISGILNIDKPQKWTSHDVVAKVRRLSGQKRVGHAGTLDPLATGVLLVCLGQATRVSEYLMRGRKVYRAAVYLGLSTDTYDAEGRVTAGVPEVNVTPSQLEEALSAFVGRIEQTPPMYSALKYQGTPLHRLARQGKTVERKPRPVEIYDIKLLDWSSPVFTIEVACSPGTYLRSLAHDLGQRLGCGAHLSSLTRLASGHFTLDEAISLDALGEAFATGRWAELIHPLDEALLDFEAITVESQAERQIRSGQQVQGPTPSSSSPLCRAYSTEGKLIALLQYDAQTGLWQPKKVFSQGS